jgi:hypothetical protein
VKLIPISLSTAIVLHEVLTPLQHEAIEPQPHIDPENDFSKCEKAVAGITSGGKSDAEEHPGQFQRNTLYTKSLRVKKTRNPKQEFQTLDVFVDTAGELANAYPEMKPWERQMHFQMFQFQVRMTSLRTHGCGDYSFSLPLVAKALGISA